MNIDDQVREVITPQILNDDTMINLKQNIPSPSVT